MHISRVHFWPKNVNYFVRIYFNDWWKMQYRASMNVLRYDLLHILHAYGSRVRIVDTLPIDVLCTDTGRDLNFERHARTYNLTIASKDSFGFFSKCRIKFCYQKFHVTNSSLQSLSNTTQQSIKYSKPGNTLQIWPNVVLHPDSLTRPSIYPSSPYITPLPFPYSQNATISQKNLAPRFEANCQLRGVVSWSALLVAKKLSFAIKLDTRHEVSSRFQRGQPSLFDGRARDRIRLTELLGPFSNASSCT